MPASLSAPVSNLVIRLPLRCGAAGLSRGDERASMTVRRLCHSEYMFSVGHASGSRIVHLTHTSLVADALCGEIGIDRLGEPDLAIVCEECAAAAASAAGARPFELAPPLKRAA
jgi:hypothetical protein